VLNRTGRARLLACTACGVLATCERCDAAVAQPEDALVCGRCATSRPAVCLNCHATRFKNLRAGVTRVREELEALAGETVVDISGAAAPDVTEPSARVIVGTEAALHRVIETDVVAFLDFDQELLAPRYRASEEAFALLARAARLVGGRRSGARVLVQTRVPDHEVIDAALHGDPSRVSAAERARRTDLRFPPFSAMAAVSGPGAAALIDGVTGLGVEVLGPAKDVWLVRADTHDLLSDALLRAPRPTARVRVEVDPLRI
jgi:primosomal protein N' (replication factor Y)